MLFPPEIIEHTTESHYVSHSKPFKAIYIGILLFSVAVITILPLVSVEITNQSRGVIRTPNESNQIQAIVNAQIITNNLAEGKTVLNGDTLLVLRTDNLDEKILLKQKQIIDNNQFISDLKNLIIGVNTLTTPKYQIEYQHYLAKSNELTVKLKLLKKEFELAEYLYNEKVTPEMEFLQKKNLYESTISQLSFIEQQSLNIWQAEKTRLELENKEINSLINQLQDEKRQYVLIAPINGALTNVSGIQVGSYISPGTQVAQISPDNELLAECYISPSDIGYIYTGQKVNLQLDAFNYNQWGLIYAEVIQISEDIISLNDQPVFKVRCQLSKNFLVLKSGHKGYLKKGMTLTGRFKLTKRTLYQLLFDKMDDWFNPKIKS